MRREVNHCFVVFSDSERAKSELRSFESATKNSDQSAYIIYQKVEVSAVFDGLLCPPEF